VIALGLRDHGFEVIYTGLHRTPEAVARAAVDEDVDLVGVSILSGAHGTLVPRLIDALREEGSEIPVVVGGFIPDDDIDPLITAGVRRIYLSDTPITEIASDLSRLVEDHRGQDRVEA